MVNSKWQTALIVALRILIGWHLLYEGIYKLAYPEWSSAAFLAGSQGIFSGIADWIDGAVYPDSSHRRYSIARVILPF
jgi:thiosulfate dehydrogenase [quinone] large subunit